MSEMNMRSVILGDPAPSRWSYRLLRLMLTPYLRICLFYGVPLGLLAVELWLNFSNEDRRDALREMYDTIYLSIIERPEFMVNVMSVSGASDTLTDDVREVLPIDLPVSSFALDLDQVHEMVMGLGPVKDVVVRVQSGGVLEINVMERTPAFLWRRANGLELLDETGAFVRQAVTRLDYPHLPLIAGEEADTQIETAQSILVAAAPLHDRLRGLVFIGGRRFDVVLDGGQIIRLPEQDPVSALERAIMLDHSEQLLARAVSVIDLRLENRPTLQVSESALDILKDNKNMQLRQTE